MSSYGCVILGQVTDKYEPLNVYLQKLDSFTGLNGHTSIFKFIESNNLSSSKAIQTYNYMSNSIKGFFLEYDMICGIVVSTK